MSGARSIIALIPPVVLVDRRRHVALPAMREEEDVGRRIRCHILQYPRRHDPVAAVRAIVRTLHAILVERNQRVGRVSVWDLTKGHARVSFDSDDVSPEWPCR
jgi:hypothetical protein